MMKQKKIYFVIIVVLCILCFVSVSLFLINKNNAVSLSVISRDGVVLDLGKWRGRENVYAGIGVEVNVYDVDRFKQSVAALEEYDESFCFKESDGTETIYLFKEKHGFVLKIKGNTVDLYCMETLVFGAHAIVFGDFCPEGLYIANSYKACEWRSYAVTLEDVKRVYGQLDPEASQICDDYVLLKAYEKVSDGKYKPTDFCVKVLKDENNHIVMERYGEFDY